MKKYTSSVKELIRLEKDHANASKNEASLELKVKDAKKTHDTEAKALD
jgi:hypothetical protein